VVDWGPVDRAIVREDESADYYSTEYDCFVKPKNQPLTEVDLSEGPNPGG